MPVFFLGLFFLGLLPQAFFLGFSPLQSPAAAENIVGLVGNPFLVVMYLRDFMGHIEHAEMFSPKMS